MRILDESLLFKATEDVLEILKNDAENCLKSWQETESIISQKANSMLQFLIPSVMAIFGFMISRFDNFVFDGLLMACFIEIIILCLSIYYIYNVANLKPVPLSGVRPSDILDEHTYNDSTHYTRNRVFGLEKAIALNESVHNKRIKYYKRALKTIVIGTFLVIIVFSLQLVL